MKRVIFILCHGNWAEILVKDIQEYFGIRTEIKIFPLYKEDCKDVYESYVKENMLKHEHVIFLTDLFGSTTYYIGLKLAIEYEMLSFSNLNTEILLKLDSYVDSCLSDEEIRKQVISNYNFQELVQQYNLKFGGS